MSHNEKPDPFGEWRRTHPHATLSPDENRKITQWVNVSVDMLHLFDEYEDEIEPWLKGTERPEPDFVKFIARYGYIVITTGDWKELPVDIPEDQVDYWDKNSALVVTMDMLRDWRAAVSGSVVNMLQVDCDRTVGTIKRQLSERYSELNALRAKPTSEFTPTQWDYDSMDYELVAYENEELGRIFDRFEDLYCFERGIEMLRMIVITEDDPEFDLPNSKFYEALTSIDSQALVETLHDTEPKLKNILRLWSSIIMESSGRPYYYNSDTAPELFWWRHWKNDSRNSPRQNSNRNRRPRK